jgi:tetratricopeptide (TPR) repeat protein
LDDALTHAQQDGDHKCVAEALICKGRRLTASGAASEAIPLLQQASTIADKLGRIPLAACAQIEIGIALLKLDSPIEGLQLISSGHQALAQQGLFTTEFHRAQNIVETMEWVFSGKNKFAVQGNFDGCVSLLGPDIVRKLLRFLFSECIQANSVAAAQRIYDLDKSAFSEQDRVALLSPLERGRWLAATAGSLPAEGVPTEKTIDAAENHRANAVTYRGAGMWSEAVAEFEKALEIYRELGDADAAANICGDIGSCLIEVNRFADAEHFFKDALTLSSPTSFDQVARLRNNLGFLYQRMGRAAEARRQYELCLEACRTFEANPVAVLAYVNIGELSMTIGEYDPAAAAFRKVIALTETISADEHRERMRLWGISAHINLASILNAQEQDLDTLKAIRDGVGRIVDAGLKESTLQIWQGVGNLSEQLSDGFSGLVKECLEVASTECTDEGAGVVFALYCCACGLLENDERAILDAMHVVRANGRAELAVRVCEYLLSENPAARRTHLVLASCLSDSGKKHAALAELEWCIASDPKDPIAYNNKANELYALGRYEETILAADIAIKIHPMYLSAIEVRAFALCCIGDTEAAQNAFLKIAEADPRSSRGAMARQLHQLLTSLPRNKFLATWEKIKSSASPR